MSDHSSHELAEHNGHLAHPLESWDTPVAEPEEGLNPFKLVLDRMHGRWRWALLLGLILSPIFAYIGWAFAPVTYNSRGSIQVQSSLPALIAPTQETEQIKVDQEMQNHLQSVLSGQVIISALQDPEMAPYLGSDPLTLAAEIQSGLNGRIPPKSNLIILSFIDEDRNKSSAIVRSILRSYEKLYAPSPEVELAEKRQKINELIQGSDLRIRELKRRRELLYENSRYGITNLELLVNENVQRLREVDTELRLIGLSIASIQASAERDGREADPENPQDRIQPSEQDLAAIEPEYRRAKEILATINIEMKALDGQVGSPHPRFRRLKANATAQQAYFDQLVNSATQRWLSGPGLDFTMKKLQDRQSLLNSEKAEISSQNREMNTLVINSADLNDDLSREKNNRGSYSDRLTDLVNEEDAVKQGRIQVMWEQVTPEFAPTNDKRLMATLGGGVGGFFLGFITVFLVGTLDRKTFGVRQFEDSPGKLRTLGVIPDMDEFSESDEAVNLATDCVHRIRARIEARRSPERGYALMVTSPYQGDGKTTMAVSLGWSYAESGYRTVLVDADFIGRAMTHQFGRLREPGLREIIRSGRMNDEVVELGHPNLNLLGVGFDRRVSAANLNAGVLRRVIESLRDHYDIIIIDTGPMTASIETLPVASVCDGVVMALRRGRSRARMAECIDDIRGVGADYLGVVLNSADRKDCIQYGSISRTSVQILSALEGAEESDDDEGNHPLIDPMGRDGDK